MFAVIKTGGKQYRVAVDDKLKVEKVKGEVGEIVQFGEVLVVGGETPTLGAPMVAGASVAAEVLENGSGPKVISFKKRRRKNSRRKRGHRWRQADAGGAGQGVPQAQARPGRRRSNRGITSKCLNGDDSVTNLG